MKDLKTNPEVYFISDLHIRFLNERNGQTLLRFLSFLQQSKSATHLFLLGDIFDLWLSDHAVFEQRFAPIVEKLADLVEAGMSVQYIEGNHDMHIDRYWEQLGIGVSVDPIFVELGNKIFRLEHGDLINPEDVTYLKYRNFARHQITEAAIHTLPGGFWDFVGNSLSKESRKKSGQFRQQNEERLRAMIRSHAQRVYPEKHFDVLVSGHMHIQDDVELPVPGRTIRSINLGSWFEEPMALRFANGELTWFALNQI